MLPKIINYNLFPNYTSINKIDSLGISRILQLHVHQETAVQWLFENW